jgi:hypothetical protein
MFTKAELDARAPNNPVFVQAVGFTGVQVNTAGLTRLGLTAGMPGVVVGPDGQPTGTASQAASRSIGAELGQLTTEEQADCLEDFMREANRVGLTGSDDPRGNDPFDPNGTGITVLRDQHGYQGVNLLYRQGRMTTRVTFNLSCFGPDAVIGVECVKRHTFNAISRLGDDMVNMWEEVNETEAQMDDLGWVMLHPGEGPEDPRHEVLDQLASLGAGIVPTIPVHAAAAPPTRRTNASTRATRRAASAPMRSTPRRTRRSSASGTCTAARRTCRARPASSRSSG